METIRKFVPSPGRRTFDRRLMVLVACDIAENRRRWGQLRKAVEKVQDGELWIERRLVAALVDALRCVERSSGARFVPDGPAFDGLTPRKCQAAGSSGRSVC